VAADDDQIATVLGGVRKNPANEVGEKNVARDTAPDRFLQRIHGGSERFPDLPLDEGSEGLTAIVSFAHHDFGTQKYRQLDHVEQVDRCIDFLREHRRLGQSRARTGREVGGTQDALGKGHRRLNLQNVCQEHRSWSIPPEVTEGENAQSLRAAPGIAQEVSGSPRGSLRHRGGDVRQLIQGPTERR
jgi:hypothetical protein